MPKYLVWEENAYIRQYDPVEAATPGEALDLYADEPYEEGDSESTGRRSVYLADEDGLPTGAAVLEEDSEDRLRELAEALAFNLRNLVRVMEAHYPVTLERNGGAAAKKTLSDAREALLL
jgi:hypothetical protein